MRVQADSDSSVARDHAARQYATVRENLNARVALYRYGTAPPWYPWVAQRLRARGNDRVLDVGAGTGHLWKEGLGGVVRSAVLADAFGPMREALRPLVSAGTSVLGCRAESLPFVDGSFDAGLALHVLYHLDDPQVGVDELARVVRIGGQVAVATNGEDHMSELAEVCATAGFEWTAGEATHLRFSISDAEQALATRFGNVEVHRYINDIVVPDAGPVVAYVASLLGTPGDGEREALTRAVKRAMHGSGRFVAHSSTALLTAVV